MSTWQKLKLLNHPKGISIKRGYYFKRYDIGQKAGIKAVVDAYFRILFPQVHKLVTKKK